MKSQLKVRYVMMTSSRAADRRSNRTPFITTAPCEPCKQLIPFKNSHSESTTRLSSHQDLKYRTYLTGFTMRPPPSTMQVWPQRHQFSFRIGLSARELEVDLAIQKNSERGGKEDWRHLRIRGSTCVQIGQFGSSNLVDSLPEHGKCRIEREQ